MAEILVMAQDAYPDGERTGAWMSGMPVVVQPDGHEWGRREGPPRFHILRLPGVSVEELAYLNEPVIERAEVDGEEEVRILRRRRLTVEMTRLPVPLREELERGGRGTIEGTALERRRKLDHALRDHESREFLRETR